MVTLATRSPISHEYLVDVISRIESGWPMKRLSELTPANWLAQKTAQ
jgi:hypothetical protein